jgi:hypothetical protein
MKPIAESEYVNIKHSFKKGDALMPLLFNFAVEYAIRKAQVNQDGLKLHGTHLLVVFADDVNIMGGSIRIIKQNTDALVAASKENGLDWTEWTLEWTEVMKCLLSFGVESFVFQFATQK